MKLSVGAVRINVIRSVAVTAAIAPAMSVAILAGPPAGASPLKASTAKASTAHAGPTQTSPTQTRYTQAVRASIARLRELGELRGANVRQVLAQLNPSGAGATSPLPIRVGTITGLVRGARGVPLRGACVTASGAGGSSIAMTGADGRFALTNLKPGPYVLGYRDCAGHGRYFSQWSGGVAWQSRATRVGVTAGQVTQAAAVTLRPLSQAALLTPRPHLLSAASLAKAGGTGSISGLVTGNGQPLKGICVTVWRLIRNGAVGVGTTTSRTGHYSMGNLPRGRYQVQFAGVPFCGGSSNWLQQWYKGINGEFPAKMTTIVLRSGQKITGIDGNLRLGGEISGTVRNKQGGGLSGICVTVEGRVHRGFVGFTIASGRSGHYAMHALFPGHYTVGFATGCGNHGNYAPQWWHGAGTFQHATAVRIAGPRIAANVDAVLQTGAAVTGVVKAINSSGSPLHRVCVFASNADGTIGTSASTKSDGSYRLTSLGTGRYQIVFDPTCGGGITTNYLGTSVTVTLKAGVTKTGVDAFLQLGGGLSGTVTDSHGNPVSGICVEVNGETASDGMQTAADGTYSAEGLPPGPYTVQFLGGCGNTGSYAPQSYNDEANAFDADPVTLTAGNVTPGIDATMQPGATITGTVTGPGGHPLGGTCVAVIGQSLFNDGLFVGFTNRNGSYRLANLNPARYLVEFGCGGGKYTTVFFRSISNPANVELLSANPGVTSGVNASLGLAGGISGVVTSRAGQRLSNICVVPLRLPVTATSIVLIAPITNHGTYQLNGLQPGRYAVQFSDCTNQPVYASQWYKGKARLASATPVRVTAGAITRGVSAIMTLGGSISGKVSNPTHVGLSDVCVEAIDPATESFGLSATDASGRYTVTGLTSGRYQVFFAPCQGENLAPVTRPGTVRVTAPHTTTGINATLTAGGTISGTVLGGSPTATPQLAVCVDIFPANPQDAGLQVQTNPDGSYSATGLSAGSYHVLFGDPTCQIGNTGFAPQWYNNKPSQSSADAIPVTAGATVSGIDATLLPGGLGAIAGTVTGSSTPVPGECVTAFNLTATLGPVSGLPPEIGVTGADGSYLLRDLLPGTYQVRFDAGCGDSGWKTQWWDNATLRSGATIVAVSANATTPGINAALQH